MQTAIRAPTRSPQGCVSRWSGCSSSSVAPGFVPILLAVGLIGCGSSVFHPESSRVAQLASGGPERTGTVDIPGRRQRRGAMGPLLAALVVIPFGQASIGWFALAAILAILILSRIGRWYKLRLTVTANRPAAAAAAPAHHLGKRKIRLALGILGVLVFSKYFYIASMTNYFTFFLMDKFEISVQGAPVLPLHIPRGIGCRHGRRRAAGRPVSGVNT